jgi:hypothetical protein
MEKSVKSSQLATGTAQITDREYCTNRIAKQAKETQLAGGIVTIISYKNCATVSHWHYITASYRGCTAASYRGCTAASYRHCTNSYWHFDCTIVSTWYWHCTALRIELQSAKVHALHHSHLLALYHS